MLSSELCSVCSLRHFPSVSREYAAVVSHASFAQQYPYTGSCIDVRQTSMRSFSIVCFTQLKKKCLQKLFSLAVDQVYYYCSVQQGYAFGRVGLCTYVSSTKFSTSSTSNITSPLAFSFQLLCEILLKHQVNCFKMLRKPQCKHILIMKMLKAN